MSDSPVAFLNLGWGEMLMVGVVALLVFGERLPEAMRNLGRAYAKFRHGLHEMARPVRDEIRRATTVPPPDSTQRLPSYPVQPHVPPVAPTEPTPAPGPPPPPPVSDEPPPP